jgi:ketosteroid isomerase-like protein
MAHPNEDLLRAAFDDFGRGDLDGLRAKFSEDVRWNFPGRSQMAGSENGVDGALAWLGRTFELSGGTIKTDVHDILANDTHAVALFTITAEREGRSLDDRTVGVYHVEGGRITEAWFNPGDQYATDEFWG